MKNKESIWIKLIGINNMLMGLAIFITLLNPVLRMIFKIIPESFKYYYLDICFLGDICFITFPVLSVLLSYSGWQLFKVKLKGKQLSIIITTSMSLNILIQIISFSLSKYYCGHFLLSLLRSIDGIFFIGFWSYTIITIFYLTRPKIKEQFK